jgi:hypothetical protein
MEQQLVKSGAKGTRDWNDAELDILMKGEIPPGYFGDHITSVSADITKAADHRNIQFLTKAEHDDRHRALGGTRVPVAENRIVDRTLAGELPDLATEGAKSWPSRATEALDTVLNSRTFSIIDAFDPMSMADRWHQETFGFSYFATEDEKFLAACRGGNCT